MGFLEDLVNTNGVSGAEEAVREIIEKEIKDYVDEVFVDKFGNLIAHKKGKVPRVMLAAHMDEIGLMTKYIDRTGRISFALIGGIDAASLIGQRVTIQAKRTRVRGVITLDQMSAGDPTDKMPKVSDLYIDTGLDKDELEKLGIGIGNYIYFYESSSITLGDDEIICGKALDDRLGCYVLVELAKRLKENKNELFYVFTVQEEIGLYGARTSAYTIDPAWAIAVDVTPADDAYHNAQKSIGKGPCLTIKDASMLGNKCINNWLKDISVKHDIPLQNDVSDLGVTDALTISLSRGGVPSGVVCLPVRNIHTVVGIAHRKDIDNTIKLLEVLLKNPPLVCLV